MDTTVKKFEQKYLKPSIGEIHSGDTVRVHQTIREGGKTRIQVFEGMVIRTRKMNSLQASVTVRRVASGVGVEKLFVLHSPNIVKLDVVRRNKVRRKLLSYMRARSGKSTRLSEQEFDKSKAGVSEIEEPKKSDKADTANSDEVAEDTAKADEASEKKAAEEAKVQEKKEKAEAFRKAQEAKAKK